MQSAFNRMSRDSDLNSPFWNSHGTSINCQAYCVSTVKCLFVSWNPLAILWAITAVHVHTLKGVSIWAFSQICYELHEANWSEPFIANGNPATAIISVVSPSRIVASSQHFSIDTICQRARHAVRLWNFAVILPQASTTLRVPCLQVRGKDCFNYSAIASAFPYLHASRCFSDVAKNDKPAESLAFVVFKSLAGWLRLVISHDVTLLNRVALWLEPAGGETPVRLASLYGFSVTQP